MEEVLQQGSQIGIEGDEVRLRAALEHFGEKSRCLGHLQRHSPLTRNREVLLKQSTTRVRLHGPATGRDQHVACAACAGKAAAGISRRPWPRRSRSKHTRATRRERVRLGRWRHWRWQGAKEGRRFRPCMGHAHGIDHGSSEDTIDLPSAMQVEVRKHMQCFPPVLGATRCSRRCCFFGKQTPGCHGCEQGGASRPITRPRGRSSRGFRQIPEGLASHGGDEPCEGDGRQLHQLRLHRLQAEECVTPAPAPTERAICNALQCQTRSLTTTSRAMVSHRPNSPARGSNGGVAEH